MAADGSQAHGPSGRGLQRRGPGEPRQGVLLFPGDRTLEVGQLPERRAANLPQAPHLLRLLQFHRLRKGMGVPAIPGDRGPADGGQARGAPQGIAGEMQPPHVLAHDGGGVPRGYRRRDLQDAER